MKLNPKDPYVRFEVMDRAHSIHVMLTALLGSHAGLENNDLKELYGKAEESLMNLYQGAGKVAFEDQ